MQTPKCVPSATIVLPSAAVEAFGASTRLFYVMLIHFGSGCESSNITRLQKSRARALTRALFLLIRFGVLSRRSITRRHESELAVALMCRVMVVSRSGYYHWRERTPSPRAQARERLDAKVRATFDAEQGRADSPRITRLRDEGIHVGRHQIAQSLRGQGLRAKAARKFKATTNSNHTLPVAPNVLHQYFTASRPNQKWVSDITYIGTEEGWLYLEPCMDPPLFDLQAPSLSVG